MFTLSLAGCGAGSCNSFVDHLGMPLSRNLFLRYKHFIANRAMLAFGLAGFGAGGVDCRVDDLGVSLRGYFLHAGEGRAADRALCASCVSGLGAGCGLFSNLNGSMTGSSDCFGFGFVANCAGVGLDTGSFTGRSGRDLALIPLVSLRGNDLLLLNDIAANGTLDAVRQSGFGAGSCLAGDSLLFVSRFGNFLHAGESLAADRALCAGCVSGLGAGCRLLGNFNGSMTGSSDCFCFGFVANRAGVGLDAGILTGRRGRDLALIPIVALGGNLFLRFDNRSADRAANAIRQPRFGTGCGLARNGLLSVAGRGNHCLCHENLIADGAMLALGLAGFGAGGVDCRVGDHGVSRCGNLFCFGLVADRAGKGLYALVFAGRFGRDLALVPAVSLCRNNLTVADLLIAVLAVGIAGIAILGASGGFRVTDLGVLM